MKKRTPYPTVVALASTQNLTAEFIGCCLSTVVKDDESVDARVRKVLTELDRISSSIQGNRPGTNLITWDDLRHMLCGVCRTMLSEMGEPVHE